MKDAQRTAQLPAFPPERQSLELGQLSRPGTGPFPARAAAFQVELLTSTTGEEDFDSHAGDNTHRAIPVALLDPARLLLHRRACGYGCGFRQPELPQQFRQHLELLLERQVTALPPQPVRL